MAWLHKCDDVLVQEIDEELVLLNLSSEEYYALNKTARRFWEVALDGASRDGVVATLQKEFGVDPERISRDLDRIVGALAERRLATVQGS
jgi:hypothetical protein